MRSTIHTVLAALAGGAVALTLAGTLGRAGAAGPFPSECAEGQIVVAVGRGQLGCRSVRQALALSGCQRGDFVVAGSSGELRCEAPSTSSSGARGLLPQCSSDQIVVSEGGSGWRCVSRLPDRLLPSCSSGEYLAADGSSWRCRTPLPSCSSGESLVSAGSNSWRCERR